VTITINYRTETKTTAFLDPRSGFELSEVESQIRYHPLTGDSSRICHFSVDRLPPSDQSEMIEASKHQCPFCPGMIEKVTPKYPESFLPEGQLREGVVTLFPNLFPYDDVSALAILSDQHFIPMDAMPVESVVGGIRVAQRFFSQIEKHFYDRSEPFYSLVTWNYMAPAGSSLVHPHMQVLHTSNPGNRLRRELAAEQQYQQQHGRAYLADLMKQERDDGSRWIGEKGGVQWMVPFSPTGMLGDCIAVFPEKATLADLSVEDMTAFAEGLQNILASFSTFGLWSFNLAFYPAAVGSAADSHWLYAKIVPRFYVNPAISASDVSYLQCLIEEKASMVFPETTAERLRKGWTS